LKPALSSVYAAAGHNHASQTLVPDFLVAKFRYPAESDAMLPHTGDFHDYGLAS
jgi:hypothetical protein